MGNPDALTLADHLRDPEVQRSLAALSPEKRLAYLWRAKWIQTAHKHQIVPQGDWWSIWMMLAGRGAGKTRTAAETVGYWAWQEPETRWLVAAPTSADVQMTCFEGDSGLLSVIPAPLIKQYVKQPRPTITLINGSMLIGIPASEPERFRGPQFHGAWCCIGGTMIATPAGDRAIESLRAGDLVLTRHGLRRVLAAGESGNPLPLVRIDCGATSLTLTIDHPILVGDQWVAAAEIGKGDLVWVIDTSAGDTRTALSTSKHTGQFRPDGLCITETRTRPTTTRQTWWQCLGASIFACTQQDRPQAASKRPLLLRRWPACARQSLQSVWRAVRDSCRNLRGRLASFARGHALSDGASIDLRQSKGGALSAVRNTQPRNDSSDIAASDAMLDQQCAPIALKQTAVRSVERLPNALTYNLTVEGEHEFIANGVVVHNCDELAAWEYIQEAWDQIQFGVRLGKRTRTVITTTPRPKDLILELLARDGDDVAVTTASTYANLANLSDNFRKQILQYEGTKLGRQEIYAEIIDPEESGIVKRDMFRLWPAQKEFPRFEYIIQSYDCATSEKVANDPTACITWGVFKPLDGPMSVMVIDCWQERLQYPDLRPKVIEEYGTVYGDDKNRKRVDLILVEDKSAGISLIQDLQRAHLPVRAYNPGKADKMQRLNIVSNIIAAGRVWIPESTQRKGYVRDWAEGFVSQICAFPETTHDDMVDACTQALRYLRDAGWLEIDPPPRDDWDEEDFVDSGYKKRENPYAV